MKYFLILFFIFIASLPLQAQKKKIPDGFEWVKRRNLVVSVYEISCSQWLEFLQENNQDPSLLPIPNDLVTKCIYMKNGDDDITLRDRQAVYRDTTFMELPTGKGKKTRGIEKCEDMPVTGITYEQALAYCEWVSEKYANNSKFNLLHLNFRLPTPVEMDSLLQDVFSIWPKGDENYVAFQQGINKHGCALYNHRHNSWCDTNLLMKKEFGYAVPMKTGIFFPDRNGMLDLMGNVAEMTSEKGIAKGGSCIHAAAECQPGAVNRYDGAQTWLGFRVVAELKN